MKFSDVELPSNKKFGIFFAFVFLLVCLYCFYKDFNLAAFIFALLSFIMGFLALVKPESLLPFNKLWMGLGVLMGMIVSPIVLGLIFFIIFTPVGVLMRLFGRDELRLKPNPTTSHWKTRESDVSASSSLKNQF